MDKVFAITQNSDDFGDSWTRILGFALDEQNAEKTVNKLEEQRKRAYKLREEREDFRKKMELEVPEPNFKSSDVDEHHKRFFERNIKIHELVEQWFIDHIKQYDQTIVDLVRRNEVDSVFDYQEIKKI